MIDYFDRNGNACTLDEWPDTPAKPRPFWASFTDEELADSAAGFKKLLISELPPDTRQVLVDCMADIDDELRRRS